MVDNEYYIWVSATVVKRYGVNAALVLGNIAFFQKASPRPDHMCWRTYRQFAKDTGLNERTVRRTVESLIHGRIIEKVVTGNKGRKTTLYKIIDESVADIYVKLPWKRWCQKRTKSAEQGHSGQYGRYECDQQ